MRHPEGGGEGKKSEWAQYQCVNELATRRLAAIQKKEMIETATQKRAKKLGTEL